MTNSICSKKEFHRMLKALCAVNVDFIVLDEYDLTIRKSLKINDCSCSELKKSLQEQVERVFAYEFYHQWSILLERKFKNRELVLNGEQKKLFAKEEAIIGFERRFPDLVLHKGQTNDEKQVIICEIKRSLGLKYEGVEKDLMVLNKYLSDLKFEIGVFLIVNMTLDDIRDKIKKNKIISECNRDKLYIVSVKANQEQMNTTVQYISFEELLLNKPYHDFK